MQQKHRLSVAIAAAVAALVLVALCWRTPHPSIARGKLTADEVSDPVAGIRPAPPVPVGGTTPFAATADDREFIMRLREKFGSSIRGKHAQIKALEQLIAYLMAHYPDDWRSRVREFLNELFPELADALYLQSERLAQHNQWLAEHRDGLLKLSPSERRQALWDARHEAFGADAEEIWANELRSQRLSDSLVAVQKAGGSMTLPEKFRSYVAAVHDIYGTDAEHLIQNRQTELMNHFLDVEAVQSDLRDMPASQRREALRDMRGGLGMDVDALQRWDTLDQQRDQAWAAGRQYTNERDRIVARHQGPERVHELQELQDRMFGPEAETIRSEEAAGFFRYEHQRRIGRE